jgi:non-heme chloroperoxidase
VPLAIKLLKKGTLKVYDGLPHGMCPTHPDIVNADLLEPARPVARPHACSTE